MVVIDYNDIDDVVDRRVKVTNKLDKDTTYHLESCLGVNKVTRIEGHVSQHCMVADKGYSYYADTGLLKTQTDWQGRITQFEYNTLGLEIKRIEAKGTPEERTFLTEWHNDFNVKTEESSPVRIQTFEYVAAGNLIRIARKVN